MQQVKHRAARPEALVIWDGMARLNNLTAAGVGSGMAVPGHYQTARKPVGGDTFNRFGHRRSRLAHCNEIDAFDGGQRKPYPACADLRWGSLQMPPDRVVCIRGCQCCAEYGQRVFP